MARTVSPMTNRLTLPPGRLSLDRALDRTARGAFTAPSPWES